MSTKSMRQLHEEAMALEKTMSGLKEEAGQARIHAGDASSEETPNVQAPTSAESGEPDRS